MPAANTQAVNAPPNALSPNAHATNVPAHNAPPNPLAPNAPAPHAQIPNAPASTTSVLNPPQPISQFSSDVTDFKNKQSTPNQNKKRGFI